MEGSLRIAVDFDGTIVDHNYPDIGKPLPGAFETLKALSEQGHKLILWTFRDGDPLQEAIDFCMENGIMFWAVNMSFPKEEFNIYMSRKINAEVYIDDKNFGGFPGWDKIYEKLIGAEMRKTPYKKQKKTWFKF
ncbi:MAG: BT0820 family HAD-type phosphatase [Bacteroidales bacterium]